MTGFFLGVLGLGAAGLLGWYSWELHAQKDALNDTANRALAEKKICDDGLAAERQRGADLDKRLTGCSDERTKVQNEKGEIEKQKTGLEANLTASQAELEELRKQRAQAEARLAAFRSLTEKFRKMIELGQIKVMIRDGRMILKLPEDILFASGSAVLSEKGQAALQEVAQNLKSFPERNFMVAGHTDNVPPSKSLPYHSNWELSTARAVTVTEFLIASGMNPKQLVAAGYSEFDPVSKTRKQDNRRIEIALLPTIAELPQFPDDFGQEKGAGKDGKEAAPAPGSGTKKDQAAGEKGAEAGADKAAGKKAP